MAKKHILISGASGLIGQELTKALLKKGHHVAHLDRKKRPGAKVKTFLWNVEDGTIDESCIDGIDTVIHLAGANISEKKWTDKRKKELIDSRVNSIRLIYDLIKKHENKVNSIISASAIGYYSDRGDDLMTEDCTPSNDFLANCCVEWEDAVDEAASMGLRVVKMRTGVVLSATGGALPQLARPIKLWVGSPIGDGHQWVPWIHWKDVVDMYVFAVENDGLSGVFNMVAPLPVTNEQLTKAVAKHLHKPLWAPKVPAFLLKMILGEMSLIVLASIRVSADKVQEAGFKFKYPGITVALDDIYHQ